MVGMRGVYRTHRITVHVYMYRVLKERHGRNERGVYRTVGNFLMVQIFAKIRTAKF